MGMKNAYSVARSLGGNITRCGYAYLATAADIVVSRGSYPSGKLGFEIYEKVARIHKTTPELVARNLARAIEEIWTHGDHEMLEAVLRYKAAAKPSPGEMVLALALYIAEGEKTIV